MMLASLLVATLALSVAACGGGAEDNDNPPAPRRPDIAKKRLIALADGICRLSAKTLTSKSAKLPRPAAGTGLAAVAPYLDLAAENIKTQVTKITALGTPRTGKQQLDDYLDQRRTVANSLLAAAQAVRRGSLPELEGAAEQYASNQGTTLAQRFGFKACGLPPPPLVPTR